MSLLPPAPLEGAPDPKEPAAPAALATTDGTDPSTASGASSPSASPSKAAPSRAQQNFEAKLEELATLDLSVKERQKAADALVAKYQKDEPAFTAREQRNRLAAVKAFLGDQYDPSLLVEIAGDVGEEELTVEQRIERKLAADKKVQEEANKKKADDEAKKHADEYRETQDHYVKVTATKLRENQARYPLICAWDADPEVDHEAMVRRIIDAHLSDPAKSEVEPPTPMEVLDAIEARYAAIIKRTPYAPREQREPTLEEIVGRPAGEEPPRPRLVRAEPEERLSGEEEARRALEAEDRERAARARLQYGRR